MTLTSSKPSRHTPQRNNRTVTVGHIAIDLQHALIAAKLLGYRAMATSRDDEGETATHPAPSHNPRHDGILKSSSGLVRSDQSTRDALRTVFYLIRKFSVGLVFGRRSFPRLKAFFAGCVNRNSIQEDSLIFRENLFPSKL
jgi:hypothetical protein